MLFGDPMYVHSRDVQGMYLWIQTNVEVLGGKVIGDVTVYCILLQYTTGSKLCMCECQIRYCSRVIYTSRVGVEILK